MPGAHEVFMTIWTVMPLFTLLAGVWFGRQWLQMQIDRENRWDAEQDEAEQVRSLEVGQKQARVIADLAKRGEMTEEEHRARIRGERLL